MPFIIYDKNEEIVNKIVSDEDFCKQYCKENGYTYEEEKPMKVFIGDEPILGDYPIDILAAAYRSGVNNA